ncbi:MAG TPA: DMT family transporter, partial [Steroidobacteraceae bacterium]|nr:DMT family transporter [Steroidobacteraceae bacterium]
MTGPRNLPGITALVAAAALFSLMDAGMKLLSPFYPAMQVTALRSLASLPLVYVYVAWRGKQARLLQIRWPLHLMRGAIGIAMLWLFVVGLRQLPMTETYTIFFIAPLLITALSAPLLGERVGQARWLAIVAGFIGVLVVLRPTGEGMLTWAGLAILSSALCYTVSALTIRIAGRTDSTESLMCSLITLLAAGSTVLALPDWLAVRVQDYWLIAGIGISGFFGQLGVTYAFRHGEASAVAPFEYTALGWGVLLDRVLWHTSPDRYTL